MPAFRANRSQPAVHRPTTPTFALLADEREVG
jgi:hypothetical protein